MQTNEPAVAQNTTKFVSLAVDIVHNLGKTVAFMLL
jgi:hypothetical protein